MELIVGRVIAQPLVGALTAANRATWVWLISASCLAAALWQALPRGNKPSRLRRISVAVLGVIGLALMWSHIPQIGTLPMAAGFWTFASVTIFAAVATISSRSPVYCALWFALTLLGTAALMLLEGAQFLGIATVAVYAGAIVVTFLFVLMLAQPEGHSYYDRISWGTAPAVIGTVTSTLFVILISLSVVRPDDQVVAARQTDLEGVQRIVADRVPNAQVRALRFQATAHGNTARVTLAADSAAREQLVQESTAAQLQTVEFLAGQHPEWVIQATEWEWVDVQTVDHAANLGGQLFSRHLITVQAAGVLLMAALVGAVAIASRGGELDGGSGRRLFRG